MDFSREIKEIREKGWPLYEITFNSRSFKIRSCRTVEFPKDKKNVVNIASIAYLYTFAPDEKKAIENAEIELTNISKGKKPSKMVSVYIF